MSDAQALAFQEDTQTSELRQRAVAKAPTAIQEPKLRGWRLDPEEQATLLRRRFSREPRAHHVLYWDMMALEYQNSKDNEPQSTIDELPETGIPVHRVLHMGSLLVAVSSAASLVLWLFVDITLAHPAAALLALCASPFVYLMGNAAKRQIEMP